MKAFTKEEIAEMAQQAGDITDTVQTRSRYNYDDAGRVFAAVFEAIMNERHMERMAKAQDEQLNKLGEVVGEAVKEIAEQVGGKVRISGPGGNGFGGGNVS
jgi:translation initiation factor 2 alpha subunit (eIF-2alpha)